MRRDETDVMEADVWGDASHVTDSRIDLVEAINRSRWRSSFYSNDLLLSIEKPLTCCDAAEAAAPVPRFSESSMVDSIFFSFSI